MEKLDKVIRALEECHRDIKYRDCDVCGYASAGSECERCLMEDALDVIGRLREENRDLRKDIEAQGEVILELNRDLKRCREALNAQGEYAYLGGDLISREALIEGIENVDWYHKEECGTSTVMWRGACSEEEAWFKTPEIFAAVRNALAVEAEPVVHAHWVMRGGRRYCSACGTMACVTRDSDDFWYTIGTKRCPECGAHMDEEVADV